LEVLSFPFPTSKRFQGQSSQSDQPPS
jgi:hypothetical protein